MHLHFHEIFDRFDDDETALRYIWQDGVVKGLIFGAIVTSIICWWLS